MSITFVNFVYLSKIMQLSAFMYLKYMTYIGQIQLNPYQAATVLEMESARLIGVGHKRSSEIGLKLTWNVNLFKCTHALRLLPSADIIKRLKIAQTAAWLAQLGERRSAEREVTGSNLDRTNTQGL